MIEKSSIQFVAGIFALLLLVPLATTGGFAAAESTAAAGIMVPLYTYPGGTWDRVAETKNAHPGVPIAAIVNPASGPGSSKDSNYASGISDLKSAGVIVLGYVSTAYTGRSLDAVKGDIDRWHSWYPDLDGIFFDEQTNWAGKESYYKQASDYAYSKGLTFTVGNPGANSLPSYLDTVDVVLVYESPGLPNLDNYKSWSPYPNDKLGMIPFSVSSLPTSWVENAAETIGWIYVTNDALPNPWDSLPSYFGDLAGLLDNGSTPNPEHTLSVKSVDQNGNAINGMWMEVKKNGVTVKTGFTPLTVSLEESTAYTVSASNYQQIIFDHWSDGSKSSTTSVNLSGDSSLTAHYGNGVTITPLSVSMHADKTSALAGSSIAFSASIQGGTAPYTWSVQFGDGTTSPYSSAATVSKTYNTAGTFSAVATAKDAAGKVAGSLPVVITITPKTNTLSVKTVDSAGSPITGYYTVLSQNGAQIKTAFSPVTFTLNSGQTYQVAVSDYGSYFFDHWEDGSKSRTRTIVAGQTSAVTAYYSTAPKDVTLTVKSVSLGGSAINGMWTVIGGSGSKTGFTPMSYTATAGTSYTVTMADYKNYIFDHWEDGSKSRTRTVTPGSDLIVTAYYKQ
jgi:spherulation-specific family 4 protein/PKD domain-containing protein